MCTISASVGGAPSSAPLEKIRNSSSLLSVMMVARTSGIDRPVLPAGAVRQMVAIKRGRLEIGRVHAAAVERRVELGEAVVAQRQITAHEASAAVAADEILRAPGFPRAVAGGGGIDRHAVCVVVQLVRLPAEADRDVRTPARLRQQKRFDVHLVGAQDRLGDLIGRGGLRHSAPFFRLRRHADAAQLPPGQAGVIAHVQSVDRPAG